MRWIVRLELCDTGMLSAAELLTKMRTVLTYAAGRLSSRAAPPAAPRSARTSTTPQKRRTTDERFGCCIPTPVQVAATSVAGGRDVEVPGRHLRTQTPAARAVCPSAGCSPDRAGGDLVIHRFQDASALGDVELGDHPRLSRSTEPLREADIGQQGQ